MPKEYIGDSVYVDCDGYAITLTTESGCGPTNKIFLEPPVWAALKRYVERLEQAAKEQQMKGE